MRKKSKYRPKPVVQDPIKYVLDGFKTIADHESYLDVQLRNHAAMESLTKGNGTKADAQVITNALNIALGLVTSNPDLGIEYEDIIRAAHDALFDMGTRGVQTGRFLFTGPEMSVVNVALELHDEQLKHATVKDVENALSVVHRVIAMNKARVICAKVGKGWPDV